MVQTPPCKTLSIAVFDDQRKEDPEARFLILARKKKELTLHGVILKGHVAQKCHWCRPVIVFHVSFPNEIRQSTKLLVVGTYAVAMSTPTVLAAA